MDAYLAHIIDDIRSWPQTLQSNLEKGPAKERMTSFRELLSYEAFHLPVAEKLKAADIRRLVRQFELFCKTHGIRLHWPLHLSFEAKYALVLEHWGKANIRVNADRTATVYFCSGHLAICTFGSKDCICGAKFKPFPQSHLGPAA